MNKKNKADVTVIVPCFKSSNTIQNTLHSVINQYLLPKFLIIVFDGDPEFENTIRIMHNSVEKLNQIGVGVTIVKNNHNKGPAFCRNIAWDMASTKYLSFLDSDDYWSPNKLNLQIALMEEYDLDLCCSDIAIARNVDEIKIYKEKNKISTKKELILKNLTVNKMLIKNLVYTSTVTLKREIKRRFNESIKIKAAEDYSLWLTILSESKNNRKMCTPLSFSFKRGYGVSGLTGDIVLSHRSILFCLSEAYLNGSLSYLQFKVAILIEKIKFVRRYLIVEFEKALPILS